MDPRKKIQFDGMLSPKFFELAAGMSDIDAVASFSDFPLPASVEQMREFLQSAQGELFREKMQNLITKLEIWALENGIDDKGGCLVFRNNYTEYTGSNDEMNAVYFQLFRFGVPFLVKILEQLNVESIPLDTRKNIVINLVRGLGVCAPGTYTNIINAYMELCAALDISHELMMIKVAIAKETAIDLINSLLIRGTRMRAVPPGNEIHYVNAVLNTFQDELGIPVIDDHYVNEGNVCRRDIVNILCGEFHSEISKNLTLSVVIQKIIADLNIQVWFECLNEALAQGCLAKFNDLLKSFEDKLSKIGAANCSAHGLVVMSDDYLSVRTLSHFHEENLHAAILSSFIKSGYISSAAYVIDVSDDYYTYIPSEEAISEAFTDADGDIKSFVHSAIDAFCENKDIAKTMLLLVNERRDIRMDMTKYIIGYLQRGEIKHRNDVAAAEHNLIQYLCEIIPRDFLIILKCLPIEYRAAADALINTFDDSVLDELGAIGDELIEAGRLASVRNVNLARRDNALFRDPSQLPERGPDDDHHPHPGNIN